MNGVASRSERGEPANVHPSSAFDALEIAELELGMPQQASFATIT